MSGSPHVTFVPGAAGLATFWTPVADALPARWTHRLLDLPGLGSAPHHPAIGSYDDLVAHVAEALPASGVLVGQSMGGYVALAAALRNPSRVSHLVLAVTAGGLDMAALDAIDWRPGYRDEYPSAAAWATDVVPDLSHRLTTLDVPTLLVWATNDATSPLSVAHRLQVGLPRASLVTFDTDDHWVARTHAVDTARAIARFVAGDPA